MVVEKVRNWLRLRLQSVSVKNSLDWDGLFQASLSDGELVIEHTETGQTFNFKEDGSLQATEFIGSISESIDRLQADYVVYIQDGETVAQNTDTGQVDYSSDFAEEVFKPLFDEHIGEPLKVEVKSGVYEVNWGKVFLDSNQGIVGAGPGSTVFRPPDDPEQPPETNVGILNSYGGIENGDFGDAVGGRDEIVQNSYYRGLTIDGRDGNHDLSGQLEGLELDGAEWTMMDMVEVRDVPADGFDLDDTKLNIGFRCRAINTTDGFHNSSNADHNIWAYCYVKDNFVGFTQQNGAEGNVFISPVIDEGNTYPFDFPSDDPRTKGRANLIAPRFLDGYPNRLATAGGTSGTLEGMSGMNNEFSFHLFDSFGDASISDRYNFAIGKYLSYRGSSIPGITGIYRPDWEEIGEGPSAEDGYISMADGDGLYLMTPEMFKIGSWSYEFRWTGTPDGSFQANLLDNDDGDVIRLVLGDDGSLVVEKDIDGNQEPIITDSYTVDQEIHEYQVVRSLVDHSTYRYTIKVDGEEVSSVTDSDDVEPDENQLGRLQVAVNSSTDGELHCIDVR